MTAFYTLQTSDDTKKLEFTASGEDIEITIPENFGTFSKDFSVMVSIIEGIRLTILPQNSNVTLEVDIPVITRPNDLFYLINTNGFNNWKAIRAGNFTSITSNREIILSTKQLDVGSPTYQFLGPSGGNQDVILTDPPSTNDFFIIKNIFQSGFHLNLKESLAGSTIAQLGPSSLNFIAECIYDGTSWQIQLF